MSKRIIPIFLSICLMYGCSGKPVDKSPTVIKIDNIVITSNEYDEAVKESQYASSDTLEARKEFLEHYLTKLLILREAERVGADKDPEFLKNVQLFWQQSLVKMMLDRKIKEIVSHVGVDDSEIKDYYFANKNSEFKDRELPAVYDDIKWMILNKKQSALLEDWLGSLRQASKIDINYKLLKIEE